MLEEFLGRPKVRERMDRDYVDVTLDTDRMTHGKEVYERIKAGRSGGLPWLCILDGDGKELISGVGPDGNIGAPVTEAECSWFVTMVQKTHRHMTDDDVAVIEQELELHAEPRRRPRGR